MKSLRTMALVVAAGATTAALLATASPASAATATWTLKAGSAKSGTGVAFTGTTQGTSPQITFKDATTNQTLTCVSGTAPGAGTVGTGKAGTNIAGITGASTKWNTCKGPLGLAFTVTGANRWQLNAVSYKSGVTTGTITNVSAKVVDGTSCSFTVTGGVAVTYTNSTQILAVPGTTASLSISAVTGCFGIIKSGDKASFKANYLVKATTSAYNPISVTSP